MLLLKKLEEYLDCEKNRRKPYFLKISVQEEMVALEKQLEASQRFLFGVEDIQHAW